jgi:hypothetical protein
LSAGNGGYVVGSAKEAGDSVVSTTAQTHRMAFIGLTRARFDVLFVSIAKESLTLHEGHLAGVAAFVRGCIAFILVNKSRRGSKSFCPGATRTR